MKKQRLIIKGKVFVNKKLLSATQVGTSGFLMTDALAIYKDKLYLNIIASYSIIKKGSYIIPFKRISNNIDGFEINLENMSIVYVDYIHEPVHDYWIGPFDIETEEYSLESYYRDVPLNQIIIIWYELLNLHMNSDFEKTIRAIKKNVFHNTFLNASIYIIEKEKETIKNNISIIKKQDKNDYDDYDHNFDKITIKEYLMHIKILDEIYKKKLKDISLLYDDDLDYLISKVDSNSNNNELLVAGKAKAELECRQSKVSDFQSSPK